MKLLMYHGIWLHMLTFAGGPLNTANVYVHLFPLKKNPRKGY